MKYRCHLGLHEKVKLINNTKDDDTFSHPKLAGNHSISDGHVFTSI